VNGKLTVKQEAFAQKYVELGNASEAYRVACDVGADTTEESIWVSASRMMAGAKVMIRIQELREKLAIRNDVTLDTFNGELVYARDMAKSADDYKELRANAMDRAKLHGKIVDVSKIDANATITIKTVSFKDGE